jgi:hypothetical protein
MTYDIGDAAALKSKFADSAWEGDEQSGANEASEETLRQLSQLNKDYLDKQGFIFLICATGMSAAEMVVALQARMPNDSATEVRKTEIRIHRCYDIQRGSPAALHGYIQDVINHFRVLIYSPYFFLSLLSALGAGGCGGAGQNLQAQAAQALGLNTLNRQKQLNI